MRASRPRAELRMELRADEERMVSQLDDLDEPAVGRGAREHDTGSGERVAIVVVEVEAVAVALGNRRRAGRFGCDRSGRELARIHAQAHGAALLLDVTLLGEQVDDGVRGEGV